MKTIHRFILLLIALGASTASAMTPEAVVDSYFKKLVVRGYYSQTHEIVGYPRPMTTDGTFLIVPLRALLWEEKGLFPTKTIYRDNSFHIYQEIGLDRVFRAGTPITNMTNRVLWALFSGDFIGLRQLVVKPYRIIYEAKGNVCNILGVMRTSRLVGLQSLGTA